jgi:internalin A
MVRKLLFAFAAFLSRFVSSVRADEGEARAVAFVESLGGKVTRDERAPGKPVVSVNLSGTQITDAGLKELAPLTNLTRLFLSSPQVTDAGLKELAPLTNLTRLFLKDTRVTDTGLKELAPLTNLTTLVLKDTRVTDAGVKELQAVLPRCEISTFHREH